jgi:hypothetical protein
VPIVKRGGPTFFLKVKIIQHNLNLPRIIHDAFRILILQLNPLMISLPKFGVDLAK